MSTHPSQIDLMNLKNSFDQTRENWNQIVKICTDTLSIQNKIILEIYKTFQDSNEMMNIDSGLLDEYQRELLNLFHFLMLILDESEPNFQRIKLLENLLIHITRSTITQIATQNRHLDENTKKMILETIEEKNIFDEQEINNLNNFELDNYELLTNLNVMLQKEFRKLLKQKKAA